MKDDKEFLEALESRKVPILVSLPFHLQKVPAVAVRDLRKRKRRAFP